MDRKWVEKMLRECVAVGVGESYTYAVKGIPELAEAIAQAHEQEVAELEGRLTERRAICEKAQAEAETNFVEMRLAQDKVAQLQAQVAVMREWVEEAVDVLRPTESTMGPGANLQVDAYLKLCQALSAAPKALAQLEGKAIKRMDSSLLVMVRHDDAIQIYHASDDAHYEGGYSSFGEDIEQVNVIVTECPVKEGCKGRHER